MGFIGNLQGPTKSSVLEKLGPEYFGISREIWLIEIQENKDEEWSPTPAVDPVWVDEDGELYLKLYGPNKIIKREYLKNLHIELTGSILVHDHNGEKKELYITLLKNIY